MQSDHRRPSASAMTWLVSVIVLPLTIASCRYFRLAVCSLWDTLSHLGWSIVEDRL